MAKRIEQLRAANSWSLRWKIYFFVQEVVEGVDVKVVPTHVQYEIYDKPFDKNDGKQVATFLVKNLPLVQ